MDNRKIAFSQRVEQNSKNYFPKDLFPIEATRQFLAQMNKSFGLETLVCDRHGGVVMVNGGFEGFKPDVVNKPGIKIKVKGRTVCHIYAKFDSVAKENLDAVNELLGAYIKTLEGCSEKSYMASEQAAYIDELEQQIEKDAYQAKYSEQNDPLTGLLNRNYFISRMKELAKREVVPTAAICVNINDWRFFDDNYGEEESDRLIVAVADILKSVTKECGMENAVIGRVEGDVFYVLLPLIEEDEAREYCSKLQKACTDFEDEILAPSVATGCVIKTNVEESFKEIFSDAEYAMLENKFEIKNSPEYKERLEKHAKKA